MAGLARGPGGNPREAWGGLERPGACPEHAREASGDLWGHPRKFPEKVEKR
jgi:hypothetical protein